MKAKLSIILLICLNLEISAQVTADFTPSSNSVCLEEQIFLSNNSINASDYIWDFCSGDLAKTNLTIQSPIGGNLNVPVGSSLIKAGGNWYGFLTNIGNNTITRLSFGNSLHNSSPSIENIGNYGGMLSGPQDIKAVEENGEYYLFVSNRTTNKLIRISLGSDILSSNPISTPIITGNGDIQNNGIDVKYDNGNWYVFYTSQNTILKVTFSGSLSNNTFTQSTSTVIPDVNNIADIEIIHHQGNWIGFLVGYSSNTFHRINFGNSMANPISTIENLTTSDISAFSLYGVNSVYEGGKYYVFLGSSRGNLIRLDFGNSLEGTFAFNLLGNYGLLDYTFKFDMNSDNSEWMALSTNWLQKKIYLIQFENNCGTLNPISNELNPTIRYNQSGLFEITLTASDLNNNRSSKSSTFNISNNLAPSGSIQIGDFYCVLTNIPFSVNSSSSINSYSWDFGDGNVSSLAAPTHQYTTEGEYTISVEVQNDLGCTNSFLSSIQVLPEPQTNFNTTQTEYCTFEGINFINNTPYNYGSNVIWNWDFNGEGSSTAENPSYTFTTSGIKTIILEARVLDCIVTYQSTINIIDGPQVDFSYNSNCLGKPLQFNNLSMGNGITGYLWDFGDGNSSLIENPQHTYSTPGKYPVILTVNNASGCQNTISKTITIFDQIVDSIKTTEAIENLPFDVRVDWKNDFDSSQSITFRWELNGNLQTTDTAHYTLGSGNYTINLELLTSKGCVFNTSRSVNVIASEFPAPDFTISNSACLQEQLIIENESVNSIEYNWDFCVGDLNNSNLDVSAITGNGLAVPVGSSLIKVGSEWYGFITNIGNSSIIRLSFGNSIHNSNPQIDNLGNYGGQLTEPQDVKAIEDNGEFFLFVSNRSSNKFIKINLGNDILNSDPSTSIILGGNADILNNGIEIKKDVNNWYAFYTVQNAYYKIEFGESLTNSTPTVTLSSEITGIGKIGDITFIKSDRIWWAFAVSYDFKKLYKIRLGNSLQNPIEAIDDITDPLLSSLSLQSVRVAFEGGNYYLFIASSNGTLIRLDYGGNLQTEIAYNLLGNYSILNNIFKFDLNNSNSEWLALASNWQQNQIYLVKFSNTCSTVNPVSENFEPQISYSTSGTYPITLTATHPNGSQASITKSITVSNNIAPEITLTAGTLESCVGIPINFQGNSNQTISNWKWSFGNGDSASVQAPEYAFDNPGTYRVVTEGQSANGCTNLAIQEISIYETPVVSFNKSTQGAICSQKPVDFFNTTTLPTTATFGWDFGDGTSTMEENPTHTFGSAGEYIVTLNIEMAGCTSSKVDTVQVNPGPEIAFQTTDQCYGQVIDFTNNSTGDFITGYEWDFGDGTTSTLLHPSHQFELPGEKNILLKAFTSNGCDYTFERTIEVFPLATVAFQADPACNNSAVQFTEVVSIQNANVSSYLWDFGISGSSTDISNLANPSFTYPSAGTFEVTLSVTTEDGCVTTGSKQIVVNEVPNPTITYQANCLGESFNFSGNANTNITNQFWQIIDSVGNVLTSSTASSFNYLFEIPGQYSISYRQQTAQLCSKTITKTIRVLEKPVAAFSFNNACAGDEVTFLNNSVLNGNTASAYSWFVDGDLISNQPNLAYQFNNAGTYEVHLELSTSTSCIATYTDIITVTEIPTAEFELAQQIGAAPFSLSTATDLNTTEMANWYINGELVSSGEAFNSTLDSVGIYLIRLEVSNESGCIQTKTRQIDIRKPILDISANRLQAVKRANYTEFILTLANKGSLVPDYYNINFSLGDYAISERLDATILPGNSVNERLSIQLSDEQLTGVARVCLEIEPIISPYEELSIVDNRVCIGISTTFNVLNIFPNPSANNVTIPLILPKASMVEIIVEQSNGQSAAKQTYAELSAGYNELILKREGLEAGVYFLRIRFDGQEKIKKIVFY